MAGGVGSRFWPMSTSKHPKQFLDVLNVGKSLIRQTFERFNRITPTENIYVVTNANYIELVQEHLPELGRHQILAEPVGRNTAPCVAYAMEKIHKSDPEAAMVVAPSDHIIRNEDVFEEVVGKALAYASSKDILLTLGISPTRPDTGYGYINYELEPNGEGFSRVKSFTEKPVLSVAKSFLASGDYLWNAGIFVWSTQSIRNAFGKHLKGMHKQFQEIVDALGTDKEDEAIKDVYGACDNISIDYGIMERASNVEVYPAPFDWSDVGTWDALFDIQTKDENSNVVKGEKLLLRNTHKSLVYLADSKFVAINGVKDLIVVESDEALLIANRNDEQAVKEVVNALKASEFKHLT